MDVYVIALIAVCVLAIFIDFKKSGRRDPPD